MPMIDIFIENPLAADGNKMATPGWVGVPSGLRA
jgi:hypothetical protein